MKKILLISGSNRKGNTNFLLNQIEKNVQNSEMISLNKSNIEYCRGCLACHSVEKCTIKDDMEDITNKIKDSDIVVFGVPNYFGGVTGLFKNFVDRLHIFYKSEGLKGKKVIFIFTAGDKEEITNEEMEIAVHGFVKYLKLDVIKKYTYQALNLHDVESQVDKINNMINEIKDICND